MWKINDLINLYTLAGVRKKRTKLDKTIMMRTQRVHSRTLINIFALRVKKPGQFLLK